MVSAERVTISESHRRRSSDGGSSRRESDGGGIASARVLRRAGVLRGGLRFFEAFRVLGSLKEKGEGGLKIVKLQQRWLAEE
ncbi:hypothetical protein HN51_020243, partial [Arachis hypogaea]